MKAKNIISIMSMLALSATFSGIVRGIKKYELRTSHVSSDQASSSDDSQSVVGGYLKPDLPDAEYRYYLEKSLKPCINDKEMVFSLLGRCVAIKQVSKKVIECRIGKPVDPKYPKPSSSYSYSAGAFENFMDAALVACSIIIREFQTDFGFSPLIKIGNAAHREFLSQICSTSYESINTDANFKEKASISTSRDENSSILMFPDTLTLSQTIRFDRPIDFDKHRISPGSYELEMEDESGHLKIVRFDFDDDERSIDNDDPCIVHYIQKNPDAYVYPDLNTVTAYMFRNIMRVIEWHIYTGEEDDPDRPVPVEITNAVFEIIDPNIAMPSYRIPVDVSLDSL